MILGRKVMEEHQLVLLDEGYFNGYDPYTNPSASSGFTSAAFRFGHSLLPSKIERWSKTHQYVASQKLSEMLMQPYDLYKAGWADKYLLGMINQPAGYSWRPCFINGHEARVRNSKYNEQNYKV